MVFKPLGPIFIARNGNCFSSFGFPQNRELINVSQTHQELLESGEIEPADLDRFELLYAAL